MKLNLRIKIIIETRTFDLCKNYVVEIYETFLGGKSTKFVIKEGVFKERSNNFYVSEGVPYKVYLVKNNFYDYDPNYYKFKITSSDGKIVQTGYELKVDTIYSF
ncbi:MAG: hypothetical protein KKF67_02040 [Nanoarchaeota archaeon]|nr:hypothetical protein [Nanoarchaeota archaeon]